VWCGRDGRISAVLLNDYWAITGKRPAPAQGEYLFEDDPIAMQAPIDMPTTLVGRVVFGTRSAGEISVYADGWRLWLRGLLEGDAQFPTGAITIVDRRYMTTEQAAKIGDALGVSPDDLYDDARLVGALARSKGGAK
jgi:hypothetical protein